MAIYMHFDGIPGDTTDAGFEKWITLESFQWGIGRPITSPVGSVANREARQPSVSEINVTKLLDVASNKLFQNVTTNQGGKTVKIAFTRTGSGGDTYLEYTLTNTLVSGYSISSAGDRPQESVSLNFTKVQIMVKMLDPGNAAANPDTTQYDLATGKA
jgi:type VI secretion system secreted protein Hcp